MADDTVDISHGLQEQGEQGLQNAPAPLVNATRDVGVQFVPASKSDTPTQNTVQGVNAVAGVQEGEPRQIEVDDPKAFSANKDLVAPHELYHVWQANLPPSLAAKIPKSTSQDDYKYPTVDELNQMRSQGKTLLDVPAEKAAQMMAYATHFHDNPDVQNAMKPWLADMRKAGRSTIEATGPNDKTIRTKPRAPMGPSDDIPGMEALSGKVSLTHGLQPHSAVLDKNSTQDPYMATSKPKGLVERGNLPIWNRPVVKNADGTHSSEYSTSFQDDKGREVLVPTVVKGKFLTPDGKKPSEGSPAEKAMFKSAWQHYLKTGEHLGKFDNPGNADAYSETLHNRNQSKK